MKATTILLAALFTLQVSFLFAGNESTNEVFDLVSLIPAVPVEAEFEEMVLVIDLGSLAPATPAEADFSEGADQMINITSLAPATQMVADFE